MSLNVWLTLIREEGGLIPTSKWQLFVTVSTAAVVNLITNSICNIKFGRRLKETIPRPDPVFIIGHWRSGTTLLHELLSLDPQFYCPTTYQCFAPNHFLISENWLAKILKKLITEYRPMDNVKHGWGRPQEDEFALLILGAPSPYRRIAFPATKSVSPSGLDLELLNEVDRTRWKTAMRHFMKMIKIRDSRRVVFKSPTHTARIKVLLEMFPDARFLHIVRNPLTVFPSTMRLWRALHQVHGLQIDNEEVLEPYILNTFEEMYAAFERDREKIPANRIHELRYEDLIDKPNETLERAYHELGLGDFSSVQQALGKEIENIKHFRVNSYPEDERIAKMVRSRWATFIERYGYADEVDARIGN
jgi:hypothetical protein